MILLLSNSSFELIIVNGGALKALQYILIPDSVGRHTLIWGIQAFATHVNPPEIRQVNEFPKVL